MKYLKVFTDLASSLTALNDAECGRLFRAMLGYASSGREPDLRGNERYVWPSVKASIDRDAETYRRKAETAQGNAKKRHRTISYDINTISYDIVQDKDKDKDIIVTRTREDNDDDELLAISDTMNAAFDAAEGIGLEGGAAIEKANRLAADYTAAWLLEAINRASQAPKDAWCWRYIEGILRRWKQNGGIDAERAPTTEQPKKTRKVREWVYIGGERKLWEHEVPV